MNKTRFSCTQQELYLVCRLGWSACKRNLPVFSTFKSRYTEAFIAERLAEVAAAEAIPDDKTRRDLPIEIRINMTQMGGDCLVLFQSLKRYLADAFPANLYEAKLSAAGQPYVAKASQLNRDALNNLNNTALQFIQNNKVELMANDNMPADFVDRYKLAKDKFTTIQTEYINASMGAKTLTVDNTDANNGIYDKVMGMFKDAQEVFRQSPMLQKQFTFSEMLFAASGAGVASVRGTITAADSGLGIKDAAVTVMFKDKTVTSDKLGKYDLGQLAGGIYTITVSATGYQNQVFADFDVKFDTTNRLDVALELLLVASSVN
jgi:hypothetical protein